MHVTIHYIYIIHSTWSAKKENVISRQKLCQRKNDVKGGRAHGKNVTNGLAVTCDTNPMRSCEPEHDRSKRCASPRPGGFMDPILPPSNQATRANPLIIHPKDHGAPTALIVVFPLLLQLLHELLSPRAPLISSNNTSKAGVRSGLRTGLGLINSPGRPGRSEHAGAPAIYCLQ